MEKIFVDRYGDIRPVLLIGIVLVVFVALFVMIGAPMIYLSSMNCKKAYSEYAPTYSFLEGCRIEWQGKMTPVEMIRNINVN